MVMHLITRATLYLYTVHRGLYTLHRGLGLHGLVLDGKAPCRAGGVVVRLLSERQTAMSRRAADRRAREEAAGGLSVEQSWDSLQFFRQNALGRIDTSPSACT